MSSQDLSQVRYTLGGMYTYLYHDGRYADWGDYALKAAQMAIEDINASGMLDGILEMPEHLVEDYHCWPEHAATIAERLMDAGILALTGVDCSEPALAIAKVAGRKKIPAISNGANASELSDAAALPYFLRVVTPSENYDGHLIELAAHVGVKELVFFHTNDAWGLGAHKVVMEYAKKYAVAIPEIVAYERDTSVEALIDILKPLKDRGHTSFIITAPTPDTVTVFKALHALNMNSKGCHIFAAEMISADETHEAVYGSFGYIAPMTKLFDTPLLADFTERFARYADEEVDTASKAFAYAAISYDHIFLVAHGIRALLNDGKVVNPENLMPALRKVDFQGVTGRVAIIPETNDRAYMGVEFLNNQGYKEDGSVYFVPVGYVDPANGHITFDASLVRWPGSQTSDKTGK